MKTNTCIRVLADVEQLKSCRQRISEVDNTIKYLSKIFLLSGNEVRMKIAFLLHEEKELCVCDLSDILNMKIPAISQHLRKLKDAGMVKNRKVAQTIFYSITSEVEVLLQPIFRLISSNETVESKTYR